MALHFLEKINERETEQDGKAYRDQNIAGNAKGYRSIIAFPGMLQQEIEEHDPQDIGKSPVIDEELPFFLGHPTHAGDNDRTAQDRKRDGIDQGGKELIDQKEMKEGSDSAGGYDKRKERHSQGAQDQQSFFLAQLQIERRFQDDHDQPDDPQYFQDRRKIRIIRIEPFEPLMDQDPEKDQHQNVRNVRPFSQHVQQIGHDQHTGQKDDSDIRVQIGHGKGQPPSR